ncbi:hypothetical protein BJ878DRAFT_414771 [Calycina marina]|uniref:O-fucosyltransferase family protein n=1 Tax=Calycina marina TaxID=1763456 RepID=A0A9P7Z9Q8_9HELO|nr:hypothetical protein BJ878DRAFT_414771 [Calycina marina]
MPPPSSVIRVTSTIAALTGASAIPISSSPHLFNLHDYNFDGEYIGWPLQRVCNETQWQPGLTFICDNNSGGIGNIRNFILTCIRYGIDAGASELIMPQIQQRSDQDLANIFTGGFHPFEYFFDKEHFLQSMKSYCPQMVVRQSLVELPYADKLLKRTEFYPKDLNIDLDGCDGRGVNRHLDMFRPKFDNWLKGKRVPTVMKPVSIRFKWATFFEWPVYRDGPEFVNTFGDLLRLRKDIRELAAIALQEMEKFVGMTPEPPKLSAPFLGVHLRTESDALGFWPSFDDQSNGYLAQGERRGLKHAFLACGDSKEGDKFKAKAAEKLNLKVATKMDLLKGDALKRLTDLSWDQQALVDFLVLTKSAHFTGCSFSSFTMNIAFKRHIMTRGINTLQWRSPGDMYSTLIGRFESWYGDWMFMYECMWP